MVGDQKLQVVVEERLDQRGSQGNLGIGLMQIKGGLKDGVVWEKEGDVG